MDRSTAAHPFPVALLGRKNKRAQAPASMTYEQELDRASGQRRMATDHHVTHPRLEIPHQDSHCG